MDWKRFALLFLRNVIIGVVLATVVLGAFGFFLAGVTGMLNLAAWGVLLGLLGGFSSGLGLLVNTRYWSDYAGRFVADAEATYSYEGTREVNTLIVGRALTGIGAFRLSARRRQAGAAVASQAK